MWVIESITGCVLLSGHFAATRARYDDSHGMVSQRTRQARRSAVRNFESSARTHLADAGYQGPKMAKVVADTGCWTLQIVKHSDEHFVVLPKRWIVERTLAWISRNRRLTRDFSSATPEPSRPSSASP
jgi:transposase